MISVSVGTNGQGFVVLTFFDFSYNYEITVFFVGFDLNTISRFVSEDSTAERGFLADISVKDVIAQRGDDGHDTLFVFLFVKS